MAIERKSADCFHVVGDGITPEQAADHDFAIRSGQCPNKCGAMHITDPPYVGQECPVCKFWCNSIPERGAAN